MAARTPFLRGAAAKIVAISCGAAQAANFLWMVRTIPEGSAHWITSRNFSPLCVPERRRIAAQNPLSGAV